MVVGVEVRIRIVSEETWGGQAMQRKGKRGGMVSLSYPLARGVRAPCRKPRHKNRWQAKIEE